MKHDHRSFAAMRAYGDDTADRIRRFRRWCGVWPGMCTARHSGVDVDDLVQAGLVAPTECAQHSGPTEDGFAAYAAARARGHGRSGAPHDAASRTSSDRRRTLREKTNQLTMELGRMPTEPELARALGLTDAELADLRLSSEPVRLDPSTMPMPTATRPSPTSAPMPLPSWPTAKPPHGRPRHGGLPERLQLVIQLYFVEN
jgi:RNA polymerase sigma factor for flagellar operon FliA